MYTLFIGFRKIDEFLSIREAKKYVAESDLTGVLPFWAITTKIVGINSNKENR